MPWSWVTTKYSIHQVLHHPNIDCLLLPASFSSLSWYGCTELSTFPQLRVDQSIESQLPLASLPIYHLQIDLLQPLLQSHSIIACKCSSKLARSQPQSASLSSLNDGVQVHLKTRSIIACKCISKLTWWWPQSVYLNSLDRHLQAPVELLSSTACSQSRLNLLAHGLQVNLCGAMVGVWRCRGNGGGLSHGEYIFWKPWGRWTSFHFHLILSYNENTHCIFLNCWSY